MPAGGAPQFVVEPVAQCPSRTFQPKSAPGAPRSISSHRFWPTSLMYSRVPAALGSDAMRNGLRSPHANVSLQRVSSVVEPATLQRAAAGSWAKGLSDGIAPDGVIRSTLPRRTFSSRDASLRAAQPLSPL